MTLGIERKNLAYKYDHRTAHPHSDLALHPFRLRGDGTYLPILIPFSVPVSLCPCSDEFFLSVFNPEHCICPQL